MELELEHLVTSQVTADMPVCLSASWLPHLKVGLKGLGSVGARCNTSAPLADGKLSLEADVTLGPHVIWNSNAIHMPESLPWARHMLDIYHLGNSPKQPCERETIILPH